MECFSEGGGGAGTNENHLAGAGKSETPTDAFVNTFMSLGNTFLMRLDVPTTPQPDAAPVLPF